LDDPLDEKLVEEADDKPDDRQDEKNKTIRTGLIILAVVIIAAAVYYFGFMKRPKPAPAVPAPATEVATRLEGQASEGKPQPELPPVELGKSDDLVRQMVKEISSHPKLAAWLQSRDLVRKFTAAVDNIANGLSPKKQVDFFAPGGPYKAVKRGNQYIPDPSSYGRYNPAVDVFISLDPKACANLFRAFKPLFQDAYKELGYPDSDFEDTLVRAIIELLKTPVVEREIPLEKSVVTFRMLDPRLEGLSEAQKHLLRMGPENAGAVQLKLREIAQALGVQDYRIPKPLSLIPEVQK